MNIKIREAVINDYKNLFEVYVELDNHHRFNHLELFIKPDDYSRAKEYTSEIINVGNNALFVADVDLADLGF